MEKPEQSSVGWGWWLVLPIVLAALFLLACDAVPHSAPTDAATTDGANAQCRDTCPSCGADEVCLGWAGTFLGGGWDATCVRTCQTSSDCQSGLRCISLFGANKTVCISATVPSACVPLRPGDHCDFANPNPCLDGNTMVRPVPILANHLCGHEQVACPNGCANGACR